VLDCGVEDERTDWRKGATGYAFIDSFRACADRGEVAEVERYYFMAAVRIGCTRHDFFESCGCRRIAYCEEPCMVSSLRGFEELRYESGPQATICPRYENCVC
jgi:hypothetical protein